MIELMVWPHSDCGYLYKCCWGDGEALLDGIPEIWLDLIAFMVARNLLAQGYNPDRLLIVRLCGADYDLLRASLGQAAASPLITVNAPVAHPTRAMPTRPPL